MITEFLTLQNQIRVYHWTTSIYSQHMAFGTTYDALDKLIDDFIETFSGKYGKIKSENNFSISLENIDDNIVETIDKNIQWLYNELPSKLNEDTDTDLLNIRDEIVGSLNKLKYLLTLN